MGIDSVEPVKHALIDASSDKKKVIYVGILTLACVIFIIYFPSVNAGLYRDDWWLLETAGKMTMPEYLVRYFDPRVQPLWYRPAQGLLAKIEYVLSGSNFAGYHLCQVFIHLLNSALLWGIVQRLSGKWRVGFIAALAYAGWPANSWAVIWPGVTDPLASLFYLLAILFWVVYLQGGRLWSRVLAYATFVFLLMSKEIGVTLPLAVLLLDWLLLKRQVGWKKYVKEYTPFFILLFPYLLIEWIVQSRGWYLNSVKYGLGIHMVWNLIHYFGLLVFPWTDNLLNLILLVGAILLAIFMTVVKRTLVPVFLFLFALLTILPVAGFPLEAFAARYGYLAMTVAGVAWALLLEWGNSKHPGARWRLAIISIAMSSVLVLNASAVGEATSEFAELSRQERVPFRDIAQRHPTFPPDTYVYFLVPHGGFTGYWPGKFFARYGQNVEMATTALGQQARLQSHNVSYIYYFDESGHPIEVPVNKNNSVPASHSLPVEFAEPLRLEGYEVSSTTIKRGETLVVLLYWRAKGAITKDYTVFAHLVDENYRAVASYDSQPMQGTAPTSTWLPNELIMDSIIIPITPDTPVGTKYNLELGLYYLPTMEQLGTTNPAQSSEAGPLWIGPFSIEE